MAPLPFDVRRSKSSLLKLPNDHSPHHNQSCSVAVGPKKYGPVGLQDFFFIFKKLNFFFASTKVSITVVQFFLFKSMFRH